MTVNNLGSSSLLTSYLEKQNNAAAQKPVAAQPTIMVQPATQPAVQAIQDTLEQTTTEQTPVNQQPAKKKISKKVVAAGVCAAIAIAGIIVLALCLRKKPEISPELQNSLQELVDTANNFLAF